MSRLLLVVTIAACGWLVVWMVTGVIGILMWHMTVIEALPLHTPYYPVVAAFAFWAWKYDRLEMERT